VSIDAKGAMGNTVWLDLESNATLMEVMTLSLFLSRIWEQPRLADSCYGALTGIQAQTW